MENFQGGFHCRSHNARAMSSFLDNIRAGRGRALPSGSAAGNQTVRMGQARGQAAVVVPLFIGRTCERRIEGRDALDGSDALRVILTQRAFTLRSHPGETAFPGGRLDESESVVQAALREFHEELGVDLRAMIEAGKAEILAVLDPLLSKHLLAVTPIIVFLSDVGALSDLHIRVNSAEVAAVYTAPVDLFLGSVGHECYDVDVKVGPTQAETRVRVHSWTGMQRETTPFGSNHIDVEFSSCVSFLRYPFSYLLCADYFAPLPPRVEVRIALVVAVNSGGKFNSNSYNPSNPPSPP